MSTPCKIALLIYVDEEVILLVYINIGNNAIAQPNMHEKSLIISYK